MATSFYFHATTSGLSNLPTTEQSTLTADANKSDALTVNRTMTTTIGTGQTSLVLTSTADTGAHNYYFSRFVSPALIGVTSISANTWTYKFAAKESNTSANFPCSANNKAVYINVYIWRPGTGLLGTILDGTTAATVDEAAANTEAYHIVTFSGSSVASVQDGDVLCCEVWFQITQGAATAYTDTFYYDGTTEDIENATSTNAAALISTPQTITFNQNLSRSLSDTVTVSDSLDRTYNAYRRTEVDYSLVFDSSNDYIDLGNDAALWSQSLTKFSFSIWVYVTDYIRDSWFFDHGYSNNQSFVCWHRGGINGVWFIVVDSTGGTHSAIVDVTSATFANGWHHIACVYDNSLGSANVKIYLDGVIGGTTDSLAEAINFSVTGTLSQGTTRTVGGNMKDFRWFTTKALTQTEIDNIRANNSSAPVPNYWLKMTEGTGNPVDSISGTKTGTLSGAIWELRSPTVWGKAEVVGISDSIAIAKGKAKSITDTAITVSDSIVRAVNNVRTLSDTTTISDSIARVLTKFKTLAETTTVSDAIAITKGFPRTLSDTVTSSDSLAIMKAFFRTLADTTTTSDSITRIKTAFRTLAETTTISDLIAIIKGFPRTLSDTTAVSDSVATIKAFFRTLADTTTTSDSITRSVANIRTLSDTTTISDSITRLKTAFRTLGEITTVSDSITRTMALFKTLSDTVTVSGGTLTRLYNAFRTLGDTTAVSDAVDKVYTPGGGGAIDYPRSLSDSVTVSDSLARAANNTRTLADTTTVSGGTLTRVVGFSRNLADSIVSNDTIAKTQSLARTLAETTTISDSITRSKAAFRTLLETVTVSTGLVVALKGYGKSITETAITVTDTLNRSVTNTRALIETVSISDSLARLVEGIGTLWKILRNYIHSKYSETDPTKL